MCKREVGEPTRYLGGVGQILWYFIAPGSQVLSYLTAVLLCWEPCVHRGWIVPARPSKGSQTAKSRIVDEKERCSGGTRKQARS